MKQHLALAVGALCLGTAALAADYAIDPTHTFVTYEISHFGTSTSRGRFDRKEGTVKFDRAARSGRVEVTIDTSSINTGVALLDRHLQGEGFLDTARYPSATFVGDEFEFDGERLVEVGGMLTLRGKTLPLRLKAQHFNCYQNPLFKREVCGGDFEATLQRSLWGVDRGLQSGIPDQLRLVVQIEAVRQ